MVHRVKWQTAFKCFVVGCFGRTVTSSWPTTLWCMASRHSRRMLTEDTLPLHSSCSTFEQMKISFQSQSSCALLLDLIIPSGRHWTRPKTGCWPSCMSSMPTFTGTSLYHTCSGNIFCDLYGIHTIVYYIPAIRSYRTSSGKEWHIYKSIREKFSLVITPVIYLQLLLFSLIELLYRQLSNPTMCLRANTKVNTMMLMINYVILVEHAWL